MWSVEPLEVDGHTVDLVATPAEAVGPGRQQRQARDRAGPVAVEPAGELEELLAAMAEREPEHPELGQEGGRQEAGANGHSRGESSIARP